MDTTGPGFAQQILQDPYLEPYSPASASLTFAKHQAFCQDPEGWGPISSIRFDFTPCFLDVWVALVATWGVLGGAAALWLLLKRRIPQPVSKNWHFYSKLILVAALIGTTIAQAVLQLVHMGGAGFRDFKYWTTVLTIISLACIFTVQYHEHWRSRHPNGVVLFYWLLFICVSGIKLRSLVARKAFRSETSYFILFNISLGLAIFEFILEYFVPKQQSVYDAIGNEDESPYEFADVFSVLTFSWMTPLMKYGYKHFITQDDLWNVRKRDQTKTVSTKLTNAWDRQVEQKKKPSLWVAMATAFYGPYLRASLIKFVSDMLNFTQPQLLRLLIKFIESYRTENPQPAIRGVSIALAMFAVSVTQTSCLHQYFQRAFETAMRLKGSLTAIIYGKALNLSNEGRATKSTGDIVNLMAVDQQRISDLAQFGIQLWSAPFQIILCMASLYDLVGLSMLAGIAAMVLMVPLNGFLAKMMKSLQIKQMKNKDTRSKLMTEILNNMKCIKLYAWGTAFMNKLNHVRNDLELNTLRKVGATQSLSNFVWATTPFFVSCSTFTVFVLTNDKPLTTDIVFPALTLFNLLTFPLSIFPMVITAIISASVAVNRIEDYLLADELQSEAVTIKEPAVRIGDEAVRIRDATFTWNKYEDRNALEDINFSARKGELSCIVGRVGAGKSSLLQALLGDLFKRGGEVVIHGKVAYVSQSAWIMNASVRENITFGHRWDQGLYDITVEACALLDDFKTLPDGDLSEVGERGISLSGGQKARISLARAVYARADVYLLDDCLSAVDQHVGRHIINRVLGREGILKSKTKILATNSITVLKEADFIGLLRNGTIIEKGTYEQLLAMKGEIASLVRAAISEEEASVSDDEDNAESSESATVTENDYDSSEMEEAQEVSLEPVRTNTSAKSRKSSWASLRRASTVSHQVRTKLDDEEGAQRTKQTAEGMEQGKVKWSVYGEYAKASNLGAVAVYLVALIAAQAMGVMGNFWLKKWSEVNERAGSNPHVGKYIGIYFAFGIGSATLVILQTLILWIFCSIEASRKLHERMAFAVFRSPMTFFETTPTGRILNRFSSDIYRIDELLSRTFNMLFVNSGRALFTMVVIVMSTPLFLIVIVPLSFIYLSYQKYYLRTSRELKRLDSITRSPIYAHFQESLGGLSTIRAFRQQKRFVLENELRMDANQRAFYPSISANRWLAVRLEFVGSVVILSAAMFSILSVCSGSGLSAGMVGLAMSYALQITGSLNWIVRQTVEVETNIVSVERVLEYASLPSEAPEVIFKNRPPVGWPPRGGVTFNNYSARYRPELDLVLKDINLEIKPHEKIGVVGRTGAGKSSLTLALFRIIEASSGNINMDSLDISKIGLLDLRARLAIIPQDAALFEGTVRDNLDPRHVHADQTLWWALEHARLKDHVSSMPGQLDAQINEGGSNLSQGQKQLVSIARALLTSSPILVLDEATAAVDVETDALLQQMLRSSIFREKTIITIAHRINTILDSDKIVVLERGRVAEFDTPDNLIKRGGMFYELVKEAGLLDNDGGIGPSTSSKPK